MQRQRCQPASNTRRIAALSPSWASEMTSLSARRPRRARLFRNVDQNAAAWRPYVEPCIELFGAERCTFESNFRWTSASPADDGKDRLILLQLSCLMRFGSSSPRASRIG